MGPRAGSLAKRGLRSTALPWFTARWAGNKYALVVLAAYAAILPWLAQLRPFWLDEVVQLIGSAEPRVKDVTRWVLYNPGGVPIGYWTQHLVIALFGLTRLSARAGPAIFSLLSGAIIAGFNRRPNPATAAILLLTFFALPQQLRYAVEGRPYSEALVFCVASLWCLWRLSSGTSHWLGVAYCTLVIMGLYTQPLSAYVHVGALCALAVSRQYRAVRTGSLALGVAFLAFAPWYIHAQHAWHSGIVASGYHFALTPRLLLVVVRELAGGGYLSSLSLLLAAAFGWKHTDSQLRRFLLGAVISGVLLPLMSDAVFGYFYASRQLLFVLPALTLLSVPAGRSLGTDRWRWALIATLVLASCAKDISYFRGPSEDWQAGAQMLLNATDRGACAIIPAPDSSERYRFFEPGLSGRFCTETDASGPALVLTSPYSLQKSIDRVTDTLLARGYKRTGQSSVGRLRLMMFEPTKRLN